jgi:hypothetical protein
MVHSVTRIVPRRSASSLPKVTGDEGDRLCVVGCELRVVGRLQVTGCALGTTRLQAAERGVGGIPRLM